MMRIVLVFLLHSACLLGFVSETVCAREPLWIPESRNLQTSSGFNNATQRFRQRLSVGNGKLFTDEQVMALQTLYVTYTAKFFPEIESDNVNVITNCTIDNVDGLADVPAERRRGRHLRSSGEGQRYWIQDQRRKLQNESFIEGVYIDFMMYYESVSVEVADFPLKFQIWVNSNLDVVATGMQTLGLNVTQAFNASRLADSPGPTEAPSIASSSTSAPTETTSPTVAPPTDQQDKNFVIAISTSLVAAFVILATGLIIYVRRRTKVEKPPPPPLDSRPSNGSSSNASKLQDKAERSSGGAKTVKTDKINGQSHRKSSSKNPPSMEVTDLDSHIDDRVHHYYHRKHDRKQSDKTDTTTVSHASNVPAIPAEDVKTRLQRLDKIRSELTPLEYKIRRREILEGV